MPEPKKSLKDFMINRDGKDYVLYAGLLSEAHERGLKRIETKLLQVPSADNLNVAIVHATVETEQGVFTGLGDASPGNVTRMMSPHTIRMAETRAKARALRDATNIGVTAFEELGPSGPAADDEALGDVREGTMAVGGQAPSNGAAPRPAAQQAPQRQAAPAPQRQNTYQDNRSNGSGNGTPQAGPGPITPKQLETLGRMRQQAGKPKIDLTGLTRAKASEMISDLIAERDGTKPADGSMPQGGPVRAPRQVQQSAPPVDPQEEADEQWAREGEDSESLDPTGPPAEWEVPANAWPGWDDEVTIRSGGGSKQVARRSVWGAYKEVYDAAVEAGSPPDTSVAATAPLPEIVSAYAKLRAAKPAQPVPPEAPAPAPEPEPTPAESPI